jgi:molybdate transport repressor ModE-like protein
MQALTPEALAMLASIAHEGSFARAAKQLGLVPSALTYRVRQLEDALDVLLFDRSARQARPTEAGAELLREGQRLLADLDALAHRVKRVATGWEPQLTLALDTVVSHSTVMELCDAFFALKPPTRIKLRHESLSGTLLALTSGRADLAIGVAMEPGNQGDVHFKPIGIMDFVFAIAPHHPLAHAPEPLSDELIGQHRAVAVADSAPTGPGITAGLLGGQDVLTVASMAAKLDAQLRSLGCGFLPATLAMPYVQTGRLVVKRVQRPERVARLHYAWRGPSKSAQGRALQWWLAQLERPATRAALMAAQTAAQTTAQRGV